MTKAKLYENILDNLQDGVYFVDSNFRIKYWNKAAEKISGFTREEMIGKHCQCGFLDHVEKDGIPLCSPSCPLCSTLMDGKHRTSEVFLRHKNGHRLPIFVNIFPVFDDKDDKIIIGAVEILTLITPKIYDDDLIAELKKNSFTDSLTKLPNRRYTEHFINYKLQELNRFNRKFCLFFADIDDFRHFNNTYGHKCGDDVLIAIGENIKNSLRRTDIFGRWGGEEFVGVFEIYNEQEPAIIGEKIRNLAANTQVNFEGKPLTVTISGGITIATHEDTIESLVDRADKLMYKSKKGTKNCITIG